MSYTINEKFKILNREASLVSGLITNGLGSLRKASVDDSFYYQSFYNLSIGFERLLKLVIFLDDPSFNVRSFGHDMHRLLIKAGFSVGNKSIEYKIVDFLNNFANGDRYNILDCLSSGNMGNLSKEPIISFYKDVLLNIVVIHPPRNNSYKSGMDFDVFYISEDLSEVNIFDDLLAHKKLIDHASKYCVMYFGRLLQLPLIELVAHDGPPDNPYFSEHFKYLRQDDSYFKNRKTYNS